MSTPPAPGGPPDQGQPQYGSPQSPYLQPGQPGAYGEPPPPKRSIAGIILIVFVVFFLVTALLAVVIFGIVFVGMTRGVASGEFFHILEAVPALSGMLLREG